MTIPDSMPTLSSGGHSSGTGEACVMEYVSILAGEEFSDHPECTHTYIAHKAIEVNDGIPDGYRHLLIPLIGRLFGANEGNHDADSPVTEAMGAYVHSVPMPTRAEEKVVWLSKLIDVYDEAAGRTDVPELTEHQLHQLAVAVSR